MEGTGADPVPIIAVEALLELVAAVERIAGRARGAGGDEESWTTGVPRRSPPRDGSGGLASGVGGASGDQPASGSTAVGGAAGTSGGGSRGVDDNDHAAGGRG